MTTTDVQKPDYSKAIERATKIWDELCLTNPPLPILEVAENYGLSVQECDLSEYPNVSGVLDVKKQCIYLNQLTPPSHKRFTIAHELGHWLLHKDDLDTNPQLAIYYRKPIGGEIEVKEKEANCFAANLLVPEKAFIKLAHQLSDNELSRVFAVSKQVIGYRRKFLNHG